MRDSYPVTTDVVTRVRRRTINHSRTEAFTRSPGSKTLASSHRFICFSLLFAAAVCFSLNSYKMTLDVTVRADFMVFKVITVIQLATVRVKSNR